MSIMRLTIRMAVVLPQPDGPTRTQISPAGTSRRERVDRGLARRRGSAWSRRGTRARPPAGARTAPRTGRWSVWSQRRSLGGGRERAYRAGYHRPAARRARRVRGVLERVVERRQRPRAGPARWRSASRRTRRSWAAAGRADRCRSRAPRATPSKPDAPVLPWPRSTRPSGCSPAPEVRAPAVVLEAGEDARAVEPGSSTSIATLPISRGPSSRTVSQVDEPDARDRARRRARRRGRAAGSRRRRRGSTRAARRRRRAARRAWSSTRSCAHSAWSRSWPPPR